MANPNPEPPAADPSALARVRRAYILRNGVLYWGLSTGLVWSLFMHATVSELPFPVLLGIALPAFAAGGYLWGAWMWRAMQSRRGEARPSTPAED